MFFIAVLAPVLVAKLHSQIPAYDGSWWWFLLYGCNWNIKNFGSFPNTIGHFWSLAIEEQFYLIWPAAVYFVAGRRLAWVCVAIIVAAFSLRIGLSVTNTDVYFICVCTATRMDALAFGALGFTRLVLRAATVKSGLPSRLAKEPAASALWKVQLLALCVPSVPPWPIRIAGAQTDQEGLKHGVVFADLDRLRSAVQRRVACCVALFVPLLRGSDSAG
ncbi:MAG: hypothetical protein JO022_16675 [Acidobacteriaceae bacterium]|nr:hypothetical protein [Acidobacteriaceae bacterium]